MVSTRFLRALPAKLPALCKGPGGTQPRDLAIRSGEQILVRRAALCPAELQGLGAYYFLQAAGSPEGWERFGKDQVTAYTRRMTRCMPMKACGMPVMSSATKHSSTYVPGGRS